MALRGHLKKGSDASLLREMIGFAAQRLMALETVSLCGAAHGGRSAERLNQRIGYGPPPARPAYCMGRRSSPFQRVKHQPQRCVFHAAADPDAVAVRQVDLDDAGGGFGRCRNRRLRQELRWVGVCDASPKCWRQVKARFVITSYLRATTEADAPGASDAATISRLSASDHNLYRRLTRKLVSISPIVVTS